MPRKKKVREEPTLEQEVQEEVEADILESAEKKAYRELLEKYKQQNPVKYAQKREALEDKLNEMK